VPVFRVLQEISIVQGASWDSSLKSVAIPIAHIFAVAMLGDDPAPFMTFKAKEGRRTVYRGKGGL
jgi:hypothetical protein